VATNSSIGASFDTPLTIAERILVALSREPDAQDLAAGTDHWSPDNALSVLTSVYPQFIDEIKGKTVLDFGCGTGWQCVAMSRHGAANVVGVDSNAGYLVQARSLAASQAPQAAIEFFEALPADRKGTFDLVISQNSMEHFGDPAGVLALMKSALRPTGRILVTFGPPWFAPYGSHMQFFTPIPWVNLLFSERTVMRVRRRFRDDGAMRYEEVTSGLNRMTVRKFERLVAHSGMQIVSCRYDCIRNLSLLARLPVLRELFINYITCVLEPS
jgi:SAM-dependent methyltransferase